MKSTAWDRIERAILYIGWLLFWTWIALILGDLLTDARAAEIPKASPDTGLYWHKGKVGLAVNGVQVGPYADVTTNFGIMEPARLSVPLVYGPYLLRVEGVALVLERDRLFWDGFE